MNFTQELGQFEKRWDRNEKISGIYAIIDLSQPDKCYVGQSINIKERWKQHRHQFRKQESTCDLYMMCKEPKLIILEEVPSERLNERESFWISCCGSFLNGFNMNMGGTIYMWESISLTLKTNFNLNQDQKNRLFHIMARIFKNYPICSKCGLRMGIDSNWKYIQDELQKPLTQAKKNELFEIMRTYFVKPFECDQCKHKAYEMIQALL